MSSDLNVIIQILGEHYLVAVAKALDEEHHRVFDEAMRSGRVNKEYLSRWVLTDGGIANTEDLPSLISDHALLRGPNAYRLTGHTVRYIFAYAGLAVLDRPRHPAHCAFWAKNAAKRNAKLMYEITFEGGETAVDSVRWPGLVLDENEGFKRSQWWQNFYEMDIVDHSLECMRVWAKKSVLSMFAQPQH